MRHSCFFLPTLIHRSLCHGLCLRIGQIASHIIEYFSIANMCVLLHVVPHRWIDRLPQHMNEWKHFPAVERPGPTARRHTPHSAINDWRQSNRRKVSALNTFQNKIKMDNSIIDSYVSNRFARDSILIFVSVCLLSETLRLQCVRTSQSRNRIAHGDRCKSFESWAISTSRCETKWKSQMAMVGDERRLRESCEIEKFGCSIPCCRKRSKRRKLHTRDSVHRGQQPSPAHVLMFRKIQNHISHATIYDEWETERLSDWVCCLVRVFVAKNIVSALSVNWPKRLWSMEIKFQWTPRHWQLYGIDASNGNQQPKKKKRNILRKLNKPNQFWQNELIFSFQETPHVTRLATTYARQHFHILSVDTMESIVFD